ncbi:hypothetical protein G6F22_021465 [Rhizopus arrhizus]|nr:hypothetical protein G6F22_021465 [Rhizopus arrhizus]
MAGGELLDIFLGGGGGHADRAAQLAVDLEHQLDFVRDQRGFVHMRPRRVKQVAQFLGVTEGLPQGPGDVRDDRVQHAQQHAEGFGADTTVLYWMRW